MEVLRRRAGRPATKQQPSTETTVEKAQTTGPVVRPRGGKPGDELGAALTEGPVDLTAEVAVRAQPPAPVSRTAGDWISGGGSSARALFEQAVKELKPTGAPTTAPPEGTKTKPISGPDVSLIGLPSSFFDARASYEQNLAKLKEGGIPRFPWLSATERAHESAFANEVQQAPEDFVEDALVLARHDELDAWVFEVDAMKRLYGLYGDTIWAANEAERRVRAESNHALHPTAVAIARLAFLKKLDEMQHLPDGDPKKQVFVTSGGAAAGKGTLTDIVKRQLGDIPFGAVWDAAGEGDALENGWILQASQARGIKTVFAFAANDATQQYGDVLDRGQVSGRWVDVVTFANSYVEGTKQMRAFLQSPEFVEARKNGLAEAVGVFAGPFDPASIDDRALPEYPRSRPLGKDGIIEAEDLPQPPDPATIIESATAELRRFVASRKAAEENSDIVIGAALGLALKFQSELP